MCKNFRKSLDRQIAQKKTCAVDKLFSQTLCLQVNYKNSQTAKMILSKKWRTRNISGSLQSKSILQLKQPRKATIFKHEQLLEKSGNQLNQMNKKKDSTSKGKKLYEH